MATPNIITDWRMSEVWNTATLPVDRELKPREYVWASELIRPHCDRFLAMKAVKATNPPNARSKRKFLMGNIIEEMQGIVIGLLGLRVDKQQEVWTRGIVHVKGKIDFLVQGVPDYEKARADVKRLGFSEGFIEYLNSIINRFEQIVGHNELAPMIRECKSCSQYVMNLLMEGGYIIGHKMQLYHYLKGTGMPMGYVDYISKDDAIMSDTRVLYPDTMLEKMYTTDLEQLKVYIDKDEMPPPAPLINWEGKFKRNFMVEYSNYLTMIYGFETPEAYRAVVDGKIKSWNNVLSRLKKIDAGETTPTGKPILLSDKNKIVIEAMAKEGHDAHALAKNAVVEEGEEE